MSKLTHPTEIDLVKKHPLMFQQFLDCQSETLGLEVIIHEAAHMEDVGAPAFSSAEEMGKWFEDLSRINFDLTLMSYEKIGELKTKDFPSPHVMVNAFMQKHYPEILSDDGHSIHSLLKDYIDDLNMLSANSFSMGLTELNAYAHGLRTEFQVARKFESRKGLFGFLFFLKAYLYQLRDTDPAKFSLLLKPENKIYLTKLIDQSAEVLKQTSHCTSLEPIERRDFFNLLNDKNFFEGFEEINLNASSLNIIRCEE